MVEDSVESIKEENMVTDWENESNRKIMNKWKNKEE